MPQLPRRRIPAHRARRGTQHNSTSMPCEPAAAVAAANHAPATRTANGLFPTADDIQRALTATGQTQTAVETQQQHQAAQQCDKQTTEHSTPSLEPSPSKSQHIRPVSDVCDRWHTAKLELSRLSTHLVHDACVAPEGAKCNSVQSCAARGITGHPEYSSSLD